VLKLALWFFIIAIVAGVLGFGGIAVAYVSIAKILFVVSLAVFLVSLFIGLGRRRERRGP